MQPTHFFSSLRFKITLGIALPLLVILGAFSYLQYIRERDLLLSNLNGATTNLGNVIVGSLQHAMLSQDLPEIQGIMDNIAKQEGMRSVFLMNKESEVRFAPQGQDVGRRYTFNDVGCVECHGPNVTQHPFSIIFTTAQGERVFRNCKPIQNQPECQRCHSAQDTFNGVLITDLSMQPVDESLAADLRTNILWSAAAILTTILVVNALMSRMVVTRLERLVEAIKQFSRGDLSQRVHLQSSDEIGELAASFNRMAEGLGEKAQLEARVREHSQVLERLNEELRRKEMVRGQLFEKLITAQEEERRRIARDLHDQLGATLSGLTLSIEAVEQSLPAPVEALKERWQRAKILATRALEDTHKLILGLRPIALDDLGLVAAIRADAEEHLQPSGVEVQVNVKGVPRRLAPELELMLFRITQEAINNIAKHAHAQHVSIAFDFLDSVARLTIEDDGQGFDTRAVSRSLNKTRGLGLLGMEERAQLAGGSFHLESQAGHARIVLSIPAPEKKVTDG
jgi:signal transduction histidine kinase